MRTGGCGTRLRRNENESGNSVQNNSTDESVNNKGDPPKGTLKDDDNDTKDVFSINDDLSVNGLCTGNHMTHFMTSYNV